MSDLKFKMLENRMSWDICNDYLKSDKKFYGHYYIHKETLTIEFCDSVNEILIVPKIKIIDMKSAKYAALLDYNVKLNLNIITKSVNLQYQATLKIHEEIMLKTLKEFLSLNSLTEI